MSTTTLLNRISKVTPGTWVRDPRTGAVVTVVAYDQTIDSLRLSNGRRVSVWDRLESAEQK